MTHRFFSRIGAAAVEAVLYEVSATPKPGLVDRANSGAHNDMDFFTFLSSAAALRHCFDECAAEGIRHTEEPIQALLPYLQAVGAAAEQNMFAMTRGVNTHKGMIFSLGLLSGAAGWAAGRQLPLGSELLCGLAARMCEGLCAAAFSGLSRKPESELTRGELMYLRFGAAGVRGEAQSGFQSVRKWSLPVYRRERLAGCSINDALVDALLALMAGTADTNILGRHDRDALHYVQKSAAEAIRLGGMQTETGRAAVREMDQIFIRKWISPGGSADLTAVTHFLYELEAAEGRAQERECPAETGCPAVMQK